VTRTSRLASSVLALSLAVLPAAAFAQQTTAPVPTAVPDSQAPKAPVVTPDTQAAKTPATTMENPAAKTPGGGTVHANTAQPADAKAPAHGAKTETHAKSAGSAKEVTAPHAKPGTTTHVAPPKTVEPGKS
jgi:hypothetical protein